MLRSGAPRIAAVPIALFTQSRGVRYANIQETLKPIAGQSAGQMSILNEICCNPDAEEERRKPVFRAELEPSKANSDSSEGYFRNMYSWGYDSLTLFKKTNEDPGPWWNANASTLVSNWSQVGDYANAGMWSGVWRYTYGVGEYNLRPCQTRGRAWGRKDKATGAIVLEDGKASKETLDKLCFPHTPEHVRHHRPKNPHIDGFREISVLHGKRILREVQYHLGQGLRFYLVDGVFGSHPETATPYRIITDNPTHAYVASLAALRAFNYVSQQEIVLSKRVSRSPIDEWGWRRPGVLVYHAPCYNFEKPRIVEEFGGPRPKDMDLQHSRFVALEPYSIPMKGVIGGDTSCDLLFDTIAQLCARWGFHADDKGFLTVPAESILSADGKRLTLVITGSDEEADVLRTSPLLYGARHHRIANGIVSRAWDSVSMTQQAAASKKLIGELDVIEKDTQRVQKSLPARLGLPTSHSHRLRGRRNVSEFGFKWPHQYTEDVASKAYAAGNLFKAPAKDTLAEHLPRPAAVPIEATDVVVLSQGKASSPAEAIVEALAKRGLLFGEAKEIAKAFEEALKAAKSVKVVPGGAAAKPMLEKLATSGQM